MAGKIIKAVLFNGVQGLPFREDHPALAKAVEKMLQSSGASRKQGFCGRCEAARRRRRRAGGSAQGETSGATGPAITVPCPCMTYASLEKKSGQARIMTVF
jgi:hypothetical protein